MATAIVLVGCYYGSNASRARSASVALPPVSWSCMHPAVETPRVMWNADCSLHQHVPSQSVFKRSHGLVRSSAHGLRAEQFRPFFSSANKPLSARMSDVAFPAV